jgi:hypothetical protein
MLRTKVSPDEDAEPHAVPNSVRQRRVLTPNPQQANLQQTVQQTLGVDHNELDELFLSEIKDDPFVQSLDVAIDAEMLTSAQRIDIAVTLLRSVGQHREVASVQWANPWTPALIKVHLHPYRNHVLNMVTAALMLLTWIEPPSTLTSQEELELIAPSYLAHRELIVAAESLLLLTIVLDWMVQLLYCGRQMIFSSELCAMKAALVLFFGSDLITHIVCISIGAGSVFRWSRPFRAFFFLTTNPGVRECTHSIIHSLMSLTDLAIFSAIILFCFSLTGVLLFRNVPQYQCAASDEVNGIPFVYKDSFDTIGHALMTLFAMTTFDNYPDVMRPGSIVSPPSPFHPWHAPASAPFCTCTLPLPHRQYFSRAQPSASRTMASTRCSSSYSRWSCSPYWGYWSPWYSSSTRPISCTSRSRTKRRSDDYCSRLSSS